MVLARYQAYVRSRLVPGGRTAGFGTPVWRRKTLIIKYAAVERKEAGSYRPPLFIPKYYDFSFKAKMKLCVS